MNPSNNSLNRTYFIGGSPRVGKSTLAYKLAEKIKGHVVSTDSIRSAAKKVRETKTGPLFKNDLYRALSEEEWMRKHLDDTQTVVEDQTKESEAFWASIVSFCNTFCDDSAVHIVEGVHLEPRFVASLEQKPSHIVYVGNTDPEHFRHMLDHAKNNPEQDWMVAIGYSDERIKAMGHAVTMMSRHFKDEAEKYGFKYFEMSDDDFEGSLQKICDYLTK